MIRIPNIPKSNHLIVHLNHHSPTDPNHQENQLQDQNLYPLKYK